MIFNNIPKVKDNLDGVKDTISGIYRTDGISPIGLVDRNGIRRQPGFTPNDLYVSNKSTNDNDSWYGSLLRAHPDYTGNSAYYQYDKSYNESKSLSTDERFDRSKTLPNFKDELPDSSSRLSTRDHYLLFNDSSTDYFKHGLHILYNKTPIRSGKNERETWDGSDESTPLRLSNILNDTTGLGGTPFENNDPVLFGFELIIDAVSSPLLNGSVEDFIAQFSSVSEIAARKYVISDFKNQFIKLFKTKGTVFIDNDSNDQVKLSYKSPDSTMNGSGDMYELGKKAYMSYYLKRISGLSNLMESNSSSKKKYLVDYRNDVLKLTFNEDVSLSFGTLAHLYKLLYWSKPSGKNIVPENLLRFNCDIIVSEVRNLNRVRKAIDSGNLEIVKDNVSRYVYSLKECQFWFDSLGHDDDIDMSATPKEFDTFNVTMDYKYVTSKFERWVPDHKGFGAYAGYNNGAIWKIGNSGSRDQQSTTSPGTLNDNSVPRFFTAGDNELRENGVKTPITLSSFGVPIFIDDSMVDDATEESNLDKNRKPANKSGLDKFKENSKKAASNLAKNLETVARNEIQFQANIRLKLLNDAIDKARNAVGFGRMREPKNVYTNPYDIPNPLGLSNNFFSGVHNSLRDFAGDSVGGQLGNMFKGGNDTGIFK